MSYIIAFVKFSKLGNTYPVECLRTDIKVGDTVLVHMPNRRLTPATVEQLQYLSWKCKGQIKGKTSEAVKSDDGDWMLGNVPTVVGLATNEVFVAELKRMGWISLKRGHVHMAALTNSNQTASANILVRRNGIDLQILPAKRVALPRPFNLAQESITEGRVVRHYFAHTTFNLYEGILKFAISFMSNERSYDRFFKSVGSSDRRTEELRQEAERRKRVKAEREPDALSDYYDEMSDESGDNVYLGDGIWVGPGGSLHDEDGR